MALARAEEQVETEAQARDYMDDTNVDNNTQFLTGSIDDYLASWRTASRRRSGSSARWRSRCIREAAVTTVAEFELKMSLEVAGLTDERGGGSAQLRFRPANPAGADGSTSDVASTIRGAFVAVPVHGGKPPPDIRITLHRLDPRKYESGCGWLRRASGWRVSKSSSTSIRSAAANSS